MIYFLHDARDGLIKIGCTDNVWRRMDVVRREAPDQISLIGLAPGRLKEEQSYHKRFAHLRRPKSMKYSPRSQEWYEAAPELIEAIDREAFLSNHEIIQNIDKLIQGDPEYMKLGAMFRIKKMIAKR